MTGKILELGKGHNLNDSATIEQEIEHEFPDGEIMREKISVPRTYEPEERHETLEELASRTNAHEALRKTQYIRDRQAAYPALGEGLDAFYHFVNSFEGELNLPPQVANYIEKCKAVKEAIPKE